MVVPARQAQPEPQTAESANLVLVLQTASAHQTAPAATALVAPQMAASAHQRVLFESLPLAAHRMVVAELPNTAPRP